MDAVVRPARPSDKDPLMSFIKDVWGGHDYIPRVWDQWIRDRQNMLYVVEVDGVPVGLNRIRFLEDGSAWFEGARVHPKFRGLGLASMLGENSMKVSRDLGIRMFRLTSGSRNHTAHRQIARIKFREVARFSIYKPTGRTKHDPRAKKAGMESFGRAYDLITSAKEFRLGRGVFWHDFGAASLTPRTVKALVEEGAVRTLGRSVVVTRRGGEGREGWEEVCFVGGEPEEAARLVKSVMGTMKGATERWVFVPQGSPIVHALRERGFKREFSNILFERRSPKG